MGQPDIYYPSEWSGTYNCATYIQSVGSSDATSSANSISSTSTTEEMRPLFVPFDLVQQFMKAKNNPFESQFFLAEYNGKIICDRQQTMTSFLRGLYTSSDGNSNNQAALWSPKNPNQLRIASSNLITDIKVTKRAIEQSPDPNMLLGYSEFAAVTESSIIGTLSEKNGE